MPRKRQLRPQKQAAKVPQAEAIGDKAVKYTIPLRGMRGAIAERLHTSLAQAAQLTAMGEIDMTELIELRKEFVAQEAKIGVKVTYNDIFVYVLAKVLRAKPVVNSSVIGNEIKVWDDINIGVAVAIDEGLIVPVIRNADRKSISEISVEIEGARRGGEGRQAHARSDIGGNVHHLQPRSCGRRVAIRDHDHQPSRVCYPGYWGHYREGSCKGWRNRDQTDHDLLLYLRP